MKTLKLTLLLLSSLLAISAHASLSDFEGHYTPSSIANGNKDCIDYDIDVVYDTSDESLKVINPVSNYAFYEFDKINEGKQSWVWDAGDMILKGTKKVEFDGVNHISYEVKRYKLFVFSRVDMKVNGDKLEITRTDKTTCHFVRR